MLAQLADELVAHVGEDDLVAAVVQELRDEAAPDVPGTEVHGRSAHVPIVVARCLETVARQTRGRRPGVRVAVRLHERLRGRDGDGCRW